MACIAEKCVALRKFCIKGCPIMDVGIKALALGCPDLVKLKVKKCIAVTGVVRSGCLERLALCGSGAIGDVEMACIAEKCVALRKFCIKGCPIMDVGIKALALGCPDLVKLKVKKCIAVTGVVRSGCVNGGLWW
ncbi:hypothetical protein Bca52824_087478 [Brassica carinata]|uniref:Uncharacterized protein n=1 Tax=Brassica carinata TaxID=52824 RepID=A0A8X7PAY0_BRACI|nr:hypothetical protein Bca52824_087478 [Brassica carinata]